MVAMGRGGGKTPERVVQLINDEITKNGQNATARAMGLPLYSIQKYMKGIAEPSQATLEKLAVYFGITVESLRGGTKNPFPRVKELLFKEITEAGKNIITSETGLPIYEIELYMAAGMPLPENNETRGLLSDYLGLPTELFKIKGWDKFLEILPHTLGREAFKKGRDEVAKKTGINSSVIEKAYYEDIVLSEKSIKTLSESYNVSFEYLCDEQALDDRSKQASKELWSSIDFLKENIEDETLMKHVHQIESSAETILLTLHGISQKHKTIRGRTKQIIDAIPHDVLSVVTDKINNK